MLPDEICLTSSAQNLPKTVVTRQDKTCIIRLTSTHLLVTIRLLLKQISIRDF